MKRLFQIISVVLAILSLTLFISASEIIGPSIAYPEAGVTVQFEVNTSLTPEMMQTIADSIVLDTPIAQTYSLCWLTGHDKVTETITATYHKELPYDPRCRLDIYLITTCKKCNYYQEEFDSSGYISCCPED